MRPEYKETNVLFSLALIPVIGLMLFIYFNDKKEKEPFWFLLILFFAGMSTVISALILETVGDLLIDVIVPLESVLGGILSAMLVVAPAEELGKYIILRTFTWKNRHFNYSYDAIVYAVFVSLGFAALENIGYVFSNGILTALMRMFTAVPGHACYGVFMGYFYSKAKYAALTNKKGKCIMFKLLAMFVPIILHGIYDAILLAGSASGELVFTGVSFLVWLGFVIALFVVSIIFIVRSSRHDFCIVTLPDKVQTQTVYKPVYGGTWTCSCGSINTLNFCPRCGGQRPMTTNTWSCPRCGTLCVSNFCGNCGTPRTMQPSPYQPASPYQPTPTIN